MNTLTTSTHEHLVKLAKDKAERTDQPVAIVVWDIREGGSSAFELVTCRKGYAGAEDMEGVKRVLNSHDDAEILEIVGPTY
jgi:hypothetical protein